MAFNDSGLLDMWEMPAFLHHYEPRIRKALTP